MAKEPSAGDDLSGRVVRGRRVTSLSDAERDACDVMQALAGLAALLRRPAEDLPGLHHRDVIRKSLEVRQLMRRDDDRAVLVLHEPQKLGEQRLPRERMWVVRP